MFQTGREHKQKGEDGTWGGNTAPQSRPGRTGSDNHYRSGRKGQERELKTTLCERFKERELFNKEKGRLTGTYKSSLHLCERK